MPNNISQLHSDIVIMQNTQEKKTKVNATKQERFEINFVLGKNGGHRPSSLGSRSIVVVSE